VIATSSSDEKLSKLCGMGASDGINYKTTPDWDKRVRELTGAGADHIVEVGGASTLPKSMKAVRMGGTISLIGNVAGGGEVNPLPLLMKNVRLQGIFVGSRDMFSDELGHRDAPAAPGRGSRVSLVQAREAMRYGRGRLIREDLHQRRLESNFTEQTHFRYFSFRRNLALRF
jgi:NADPH:quinone reductase-like Zn-dependent oxidoreductase